MLPLEQHPQPVENLQERPEQEEQDSTKIQGNEQKEPRNQRGDVEQPEGEQQQEVATQDKEQRQLDRGEQQPERSQQQPLQELPRHGGQQNQQQQGELPNQEEEQHQDDEQQHQEEQQQQEHEQQQQDTFRTSAGQREQDASHPRKEKSRLSKPLAASSPRLDFIPKPAEPPVDNLIPIRLDIEADGQRYKDVFTWNVDDPDTEIAPFVRRLVKDMGLPVVFAHYIAQSMQTQIGDYRATDNQRPGLEEKVQMIKLDLRVNRTLIHDQFLWDVNNPDSDPEAFAKRLCEDLELQDPEIAPAIAVSIREQIHEINKQISSSGRDTRISKKVRRERGVDYSPSSNPPTTTLNLMRRPNNKISVLRRRNEWDSFEPVIEQLTDKEMEALYAREERTVR